MLTLVRRPYCSRRMRFPFHLDNISWVSHRYNATDVTLQLSEDRLANWCRRLWALAQGGGDDGSAVPASNGTTKSGSVFSGRDPHTEFTLVEEMKSVLVGEKGRLPPSVVSAVWDVYESIIPPSTLFDLSETISPNQEDAFFSFVALLMELDVDIVEVQAAVAQLNNTIQNIEDLNAQSGQFIAGGCSATVSAESCFREENRSGVGAAVLSSKLVKAKNNLLRQCVAALHAGSPVYYMWFKQSASVERGVRRLMDLRRCVMYFQKRCHCQVAQLQAELKRQHERQSSRQVIDSPPNSGPLTTNRELELWLLRQHHVSSIDVSLEYLFGDFFSKQWLVMEELTWRTTPPLLLEKVMAAESVHPFVGGLVDMKQRLQPAKNRHIFAFFHPAVVEEPLIAVQVALTRGIARSVDIILGRPHPPSVQERQSDQLGAANGEVADACSGARKHDPVEDVDTSMFYSINSVQSALRGVNLGNMLIKRVVREIEARLNGERHCAGLSPITTFSTISPVPGYLRWLVGEVAKLQQQVEMRSGSISLCSSSKKFAQPRIFGECSKPKAAELFSILRGAVLGLSHHRGRGCGHFISRLHYHLREGNEDAANLVTMQYLLALFGSPEEDGTGESGAPGKADEDVISPWWNDSEFTRTVEKPLLRSVAHYLYKEKHRNRIIDPVGNFHISNGATMFRLNFLANCTADGSRQSATVMVNYLYEPACVDERVKAYGMQRSVPIGDDVIRLLNIS
ncbi:malonyl-CoA decarboxylase, mitochondrial precursor, putative [Trypanosoma brucei gambiense DAL972]|uniref:Malonyl-CoA decarboxylase, mitochondrial, putative n=1 Tax=Trypanosoma brucei gambiense (strain MHOM/CI/86/DAL972) TaxID=679716 RepID=C9ZUM4_TRYB9|nr:malonyl-CoA decarboxylase, mitochondrial precursor, putative [Trypanosoma brucei gambiense DAL972]CBH13112.1 malonyl-CoA decarboxylase, mitochondrial precursor, putative [Trypanosoma brucei gambiense DAL972]|eukprot:XP_011775389.1 malonyl-CoA decarboxylase, mitochondrial precursor, putative [Trypanosoma brucei gambiense DAL972]